MSSSSEWENRYCQQGTTVAVFDPERAKGFVPQRPFSFIAVLFTWHEEDVIAATVSNLYAQGCDAVVLIDNGSTDKTVQLAVKAGAVHYDTVISGHFAESVKCGAVFAYVKQYLSHCAPKRLWVLLTDADEFPAAPCSSPDGPPPTLRAYLESLDDRIRCVGGHFISHYPLRFPHYVPGFHPADFQFEASPYNDRALYCSLVHDKHNLLRFDNGEFDLNIAGGYHRFTSEKPLLEPKKGLLIHHANYRAPEYTLQRLTLLLRTNEQGESRLGTELRMATEKKPPVPREWYEERFLNAKAIYARGPAAFKEVVPIPWKDTAALLDHHHPAFVRWYSYNALEKAVCAYCEKHNKPEAFQQWRLSWHMHYATPPKFLSVLLTVAEKDLLPEHAQHAAAIWKVLGAPGKAQRYLDLLPASSAG